MDNSNNGFPDGLPDIEATPLSDDYLALEFVNAHGDKFRWTNGLDWMVDAGSHWVPDAKKQRWGYARKICRIASRSKDAMRDEGLARKVSGASTISNTLRVAESDERIVVDNNAWNADPVLLNTPGGVYDLRTGERRDRRPDDLFTKCTAVTPNFNKPSPVFDEFRRQVLLDEELDGYVQCQVFGYSLTGTHHIHQFYLFHGPQSRNGKDTLCGAVKDTMGNYATTLASTELMSHANPPHPAGITTAFYGSRMVVSSEVDRNQRWNETLLKQLTGNPEYSGRLMFGNPFTFTLTSKLVIPLNDLPALHGNDPALRNRIRVVPFDGCFAANPDLSLPDKLRAEGPQILAWAIRGAQKILALKELYPTPKRVLDASAMYMDDNDDIQQWIDDCCVMGPEHSCEAQKLYENWRGWKLQRGDFAKTLKMWAQDLLKVRGIARHKTNKGYSYRGIAPRGSLGFNAVPQQQPQWQQR